MVNISIEAYPLFNFLDTLAFKSLSQPWNPIKMVNVTTANLFSLATSIPYANQLYSLSSESTASKAVQFISYNRTFETEILGDNVNTTLLSEQPWDAFHEAGVYYKDTNSAYIASNWNGSLDNPINITIYNFATSSVSSKHYPGIASANGGALFRAPSMSSPSTNGLQPNKTYVVICDEGNFESPSGLIALDPSTNGTIPILTTFQGRNYSSVNDIKQHPVTGDLWFTDAYYGWFQGFRPQPTMPSQVFRYEPSTGMVYVAADGFEQANGLEFSPDLRKLYITDSGSQRFSVNNTRPSTVYQHQVSEDGKQVMPGRSVFAYADRGLPDGIHTDTDGNVYVAYGDGDGVSVYNAGGNLLGKMAVEGGSNNFEFVKGGMLLFNAERMYWVGLRAVGREVGREFGNAL